MSGQEEEINQLRCRVDNLTTELCDARRQLEQLESTLTPPSYLHVIEETARPHVDASDASVGNAREQMADRNILQEGPVEVPYRCCSESCTVWKSRILVFGNREGYSRENVFHYVNELDDYT